LLHKSRLLQKSAGCYKSLVGVGRVK
jgi:hypothetical protein